MTAPPEGIALIVVVHDDAYLPVVILTDGWGDAYQKKAAVVRLAKADMEKLGLKANDRVRITAPAGSVVVAARPDAAGEAGIALMASSLYTNTLAGCGTGGQVLPLRHIEGRAAVTDRDVTPVWDLVVKRDRA